MTSTNGLACSTVLLKNRKISLPEVTRRVVCGKVFNNYVFQSILVSRRFLSLTKDNKRINVYYDILINRKVRYLRLLEGCYMDKFLYTLSYGVGWTSL